MKEGNNVDTNKVIKIGADSTCDLSDNLISQYDISIIPHYINTVRGKFQDRDEVTSDNVIEYLKNPNKRMDTSPPSIRDYEKFYTKALKGCDEFIHITMSNGFSKSYYYASEASKKFPNVYVVNSKSLSIGYGMMVMRAAELCHTGINASAVISEIDEYRKTVKFKFVIKSFEMMQRGKKVSPFIITLMDIANIFKIHMDLTVKKDKLVISKIYFGSMDKVYKKFTNDMLSNKSIDSRAVFLVSAGCTNKTISQIEDTVNQYGKFDNIFVTKASSTVSCYCGEGAMGIAYAGFGSN